jgi:putative transposase
MARIARLVLPGIPHHVTQRGNRRAPTFFGDDDYRHYKTLLAEAAAKAKSEVWAYCLMPTHVHIILTPSDPDGLRRTLADLHRRYTAHINAPTAGPAISGKAASARWRWTRRTCSPPPAMSR